MDALSSRDVERVTNRENTRDRNNANDECAETSNDSRRIIVDVAIIAQKRSVFAISDAFHAFILESIHDVFAEANIALWFRVAHKDNKRMVGSSLLVA